MQKDVDDLVDLLDLEAIEVNIFRGVSPDENRQRIFGGQVAGQALVAAARTVDDDRPVHSLHAYFLRPGDPTVPVLYEVDRIRDGRSFTTRRVVGIQHGRAIFNLAASFHIDESGLEHLEPMPDVPAADDLPTRADRFAAAGIDDPFPDQPHPLDIRYITKSPLQRREPLPPVQQVWFRADGRLPDNQVLHTCLLTYASDMTLLDTSLLPHGTGSIEGGIQMASLDHAMWFHGTFRADEWLLYDQHTPAATGARGLATGRVFTHDGRLIANVVQEGLIRRTVASS
ncbi:MAG: acyl-CoA thioesterase II [Acidimicrobiales bacterium]|nr:acyl-CoA thioesterase II [Acidimicrobiales bacterium]